MKAVKTNCAGRHVYTIHFIHASGADFKRRRSMCSCARRRARAVPKR